MRKSIIESMKYEDCENPSTKKERRPHTQSHTQLTNNGSYREMFPLRGSKKNDQYRRIRSQLQRINAHTHT